MTLLIDQAARPSCDRTTPDYYLLSALHRRLELRPLPLIEHCAGMMQMLRHDLVVTLQLGRQLDHIAIGISQIDRLGDTMHRWASHFDAGGERLIEECHLGLHIREF